MYFQQLFRVALVYITYLLVVSCSVSDSQTELSDDKFSVLFDRQEAINSIAGLKAGEPNAEEKAYWISTSTKHGLRVFDDVGKLITSTAGKYELVDARKLDETILISTSEIEAGNVLVFSLNIRESTLQLVQRIPSPGFQIDALCLYQDELNNIFAYLVDGYGGGDHRWIYDAKTGRNLNIQVKKLNLPPDISACAVDDESGEIFFAEEKMGVWVYPASAEEVPSRKLISIRYPEEKQDQEHPEIEALAVVAGRLFVSRVDSQDLAVYQKHADTWKLDKILGNKLKIEAASIAAISIIDTAHVAVLDDKSGNVYHFKENISGYSFTRNKKYYPEVYASVETQAVDRRGDAADDPAIWINNKSVSESRVLGTNKKMGLLVYDLKGELKQTLPVGHINNVDLRQGVVSYGKSVDIAVASNRSDNSISVFKISDTGEVAFVDKHLTSLDEVYGICLYHPQADRLFVLINDKDGRFQQYQLALNGDKVDARLVAEFSLESQPEACVSDDKQRTVYIGEEEVGVWQYTFSLDNGTILPDTGKLIIPAGKELVADVEGLSLYKTNSENLLIVSSQGDNSYALYDVQNAHRYLGSFRVGLNSANSEGKAIDGTTETDGLDVTSINLGPGFEEGMLVIQDGHNLMPEAPQNFKYVSWAELRSGLKFSHMKPGPN